MIDEPFLHPGLDVHGVPPRRSEGSQIRALFRNITLGRHHADHAQMPALLLPDLVQHAAGLAQGLRQEGGAVGEDAVVEGREVAHVEAVLRLE